MYENCSCACANSACDALTWAAADAALALIVSNWPFETEPCSNRGVARLSCDCASSLKACAWFKPAVAWATAAFCCLLRN